MVISMHSLDLPTYRFADRDSVRLRLPVAYYLKNQVGLAKDLVEAGLREIGNEDEPVSRRFRHVAEALLTRISKRLPDMGSNDL